MTDIPPAGPRHARNQATPGGRGKQLVDKNPALQEARTMMRTKAGHQRKGDAARHRRDNNVIERKFEFHQGSGQVRPIGAYAKMSRFHKFMQMARRFMSRLPTFGAGPRGRNLPVPVRQRAVQKSLMPASERPKATQLNKDVRKAILDRVTHGNQKRLDKAACVKICADNELMPRLYQIQRHNKPIVFSAAENVGLQRDGTIVAQGYHLAEDKRRDQAEDLHDTLRRVVGLPPANDADAPRPIQPLSDKGAVGNRHLRPDHVVQRRLRDSVIFQAFGDAATKLPTQVRAAIRDDDELMHFIQLSSMNDNGGIVFSDAKEPGLYPGEGVFVSTYHLEGSNEDGARPNLHRQLREAFGLHLDEGPEKHCLMC